MLASLNHPNIAAIYGGEDRVLVMELVDGPTLAERIGIAVVADLPVGERLQEHPFYYNVYALKAGGEQHAPRGGGPPVASSEAEQYDLDLQISITHLFDPDLSPTGSAIVLAVAVTQPESTGSVRLASRDPRTPPVINYNLLGAGRDMRRMIEGIGISRRTAVMRHLPGWSKWR